MRENGFVFIRRLTEFDPDVCVLCLKGECMAPDSSVVLA